MKDNLFTSKYRLYIPTEEELIRKIEKDMIYNKKGKLRIKLIGLQSIYYLKRVLSISLKKRMIEVYMAIGKEI